MFYTSDFKKFMHDLIIIGSGPAGVTAGIYAARKKLKTLLISRDFVGQVGRASFVENYPGILGVRGLDLTQKWREHLKKFEVEIKEGEEVVSLKKENDFFQVKTKNNEYEAKAVIVATGRKLRSLGIPGEKEFLGRGVGYCVTCDGPLYSGKKIAVIGGGNFSFDAALESAKYGEKVYILIREPQPKADELTQERVKANGKITLIANANLKEIKGEKMVSSILYEDSRTGEKKELSVDGIFIEIGYMPVAEFLAELVDLNEAKEIIVDPRTGATKTPGLFAAGDVTDISTKQIIVAAGEGAKAAVAAYNFLEKK